MNATNSGLVLRLTSTHVEKTNPAFDPSHRHKVDLHARGEDTRPSSVFFTRMG